MRELALESLHADGEHLVLIDTEGTRFRLPIDEALRIAVRRDRPQLEALRAREASALRPREIQARLREGASLGEVAAEGGVSLDAVRRYEGPVRAEQAWIVEQTRGLQIGREIGSPTLGDLVVDRLATRGARTAVTWRALRRGGQPWTVTVAFEADGAPREASWHVDLHARTLAALDDESRWLSETDLGRSARPFDVEADESGRGTDVTMSADGSATRSPATKADRRGAKRRPAVASGKSRSAAPESRASDVPDGEETSTDVLLERLAAARGKRSARPAAQRDDPAESEGPLTDQTGPAASEASEADADAGGADSHASLNAEFDDALFPVAPVLKLHRDGVEEQAPPTQEVPTGSESKKSSPAQQGDEDADSAPAQPKSKRGRRTSVPSWDEIVFGSRTE